MTIEDQIKDENLQSDINIKRCKNISVIIR